MQDALAAFSDFRAMSDTSSQLTIAHWEKLRLYSLVQSTLWSTCCFARSSSNSDRGPTGGLSLADYGQASSASAVKALIVHVDDSRGQLVTAKDTFVYER